MQNVPSPWHRAIILMDMDAFFASIEQRDRPDLRGKPIGVTNGTQGSCIITCSYEARQFGIKTGMRVREARQLCPKLIQCPARPKDYANTSRAIMSALYDITPDLEIFSVDEAFLDITHCQRLWGAPEKIAQMVKDKVKDVSGLNCSVGLSGDKTTAKYAAKCKKPDGLMVIPPWESKKVLAPVPVTELCGIAKGIGKFLADRGVYVCGDMQKLPISVLGNRFGNLGRRVWCMAQGKDPEPVQQRISAPKSMGHGKVMPPNTHDEKVILTYLQHMSEKLGARLRRYDLAAQHFFIGLRCAELGWLSEKNRLVQSTNDGRDIFRLARKFFQSHWQGQGVNQVQITALDPHPENQQPDLFCEQDEHREIINTVMDEINSHYGELQLVPARLLAKSTMPNVIAPAWQPSGHRDTIG